MISKVLIVGLGNPGTAYQKTRHNLGFKVIEALAGCDGRKVLFRRGVRAFLTEKEIGGNRVILAKPRTYVNRSGEAVLSLLSRYRLGKDTLLVICDDLSLPLGALRLRLKGSSGGHNGLQSISDTIGEDFARLRLGIGSPESSAEWADYVLEKFTPEEEKKLPEIIEKAVGEVLNFLKEEGRCT